jgi:hypothetical protein
MAAQCSSPPWGKDISTFKRGDDMKIEKRGEGFFSILISHDDLGIINNCINDAIDLMVEDQFHARVGVSRQEALALLEVISNALRNARA